jgi:hypothetical protein
MGGVMGNRLSSACVTSMALLPLLVLSERVRGETARVAEDDAAAWRAVVPSYREVKRIIDDVKPMTGRIPVYYLSRFQEDPLTKEQRQDIYQLARRADRWRDLWFITVHSNRRDSYEATVYFKPDWEHGKVRQGVALQVHSMMLPMMLRFASDPPDPRLLSRVLRDYVQVGEEGPEKFQPRPENLPFPAPTGVANDEVVEIIDLIFSEPKPVAPPKEIRDPFQFQPQREPVRLRHASGSILSMKRNRDGVELQVGVREGGLSGIGDIVRCRKENGAWVITSVGMFVN